MDITEQSLRRIFTQVRVPPLIQDPTGGLLEPAIAPINMIVTGIETGILSAMQEAIILLRGGFSESVEHLESLVTDVFSGLLTAVGAAQDVQTLLADVSSAKNALSDGENALGRMEGIVVSAVAEARQYAQQIKSTLDSGVSGLSAEIMRISREAETRIRSELGGRLSASIAELRGVCAGAANRAEEGARALELLGQTGSADVAGTLRGVGEMTRGATSGLKIAAREGVAVIRDAKSRIDQAANWAESRASAGAGFVERAGTDGAQRLQSIASAISGLPSIATLLAVAIFLAVIWAAIWLHFKLLAPNIRRNAARTQGIALK